MEELNQKKMIILIPFQLLKLRKLLEKERTEENLEKLKNLIQNAIIESIEYNRNLGNITAGDARRLKRLIHRLYQHIYSHYEEMEELNVITDESLMLDIDIIEKEHEEELIAKDKIIEAKNNEITLLKEQLAALQHSN